MSVPLPHRRFTVADSEVGAQPEDILLVVEAANSSLISRGDRHPAPVATSRWPSATR